MKVKVNQWGNSHGIRLSGTLLEHLNVAVDNELDIKLTETGIEIKKAASTEEYVKAITQDAIDEILATSNPVSTVDDPYAESDTAYLLVTINPCKPIIREVPKDTHGAYRTLSEAKEAARKVIQDAIAEARNSLAELRQTGVGNITYITL